MKKVGDVSGTVMSAPARMYYKAKGGNADFQRKKIVENRGIKEMSKSGMEDKGNESDPVFRARAVEAMKRSLKK